MTIPGRPWLNPARRGGKTFAECIMLAFPTPPTIAINRPADLLIYADLLEDNDDPQCETA